MHKLIFLLLLLFLEFFLILFDVVILLFHIVIPKKQSSGDFTKDSSTSSIFKIKGINSFPSGVSKQSNEDITGELILLFLLLSNCRNKIKGSGIEFSLQYLVII